MLQVIDSRLAKNCDQNWGQPACQGGGGTASDAPTDLVMCGGPGWLRTSDQPIMSRPL